MNDAIWRRHALLACLVALALGQMMACLVFASDSADFITRNHNARARQYSRAHAVALPAGMRFGSGQTDVRRLGDGWNVPEQGGVWSSRDDAWIEIDQAERRSDIVLRLDASAYGSGMTLHNRIEITVNGMVLASFDRSAPDAEQPIEIRIPDALVRSGPLSIKLHVDHCVSPLREGTGADGRSLGIFLKGMEIRSRSPSVN